MIYVFALVFVQGVSTFLRDELEQGMTSVDIIEADENIIKEASEEQIIEVMNGCICCTVRGDLVVALKKLHQRIAQFDAVLIETTGLADPAPVAQTFFVDDGVKAFCTLDGIVTLIDAKHVVQHLDDEKPEGAENEAVEQVAFADRLLLNKCDLVPEEAELKAVEGRLRDINKFAPILRSTNAKVSADQVLGIKAFDLTRTLEMDPEFLNTDGEHEHDASVTSVGIAMDGIVDLGRLNAWLGPLVETRGVDIYRMKGVLAVDGQDNKYVYHAVHMIFNGTYSEPWGDDETRCCKLMFIGKNLDEKELKAGFEKCLSDGNKKRRKS